MSDELLKRLSMGHEACCIISMSEGMSNDSCDCSYGDRLEAINVLRAQAARIAVLEAALAAERQRAEKAELLWCEHSSKREEALRELAAERAAREVAERKVPKSCAHGIRWPHSCDDCEQERQERDDERYRNAIHDRDAAANLAREEAAKLCDPVLNDPNAYDRGIYHALRGCAAAIRASITDPAAVKQTLEDAANWRRFVAWLEEHKAEIAAGAETANQIVADTRAEGKS